MSDAPPIDPQNGLAAARNRPRRRGALLRVTLAVVLLATVLLWNDNGAKALGLLRGIPAADFASLLALSFAVNWLSMLKWRLILRERGLALGRMLLMRLYLIGKFFSNVMPSVIGGDLVRIVMLGRETGSGSRAAASVLLERFTGLATLVALALVAALVDTGLPGRPIVTTTIACAAAVCGAALVVAVSGTARRLCLGVARRWPVLGKPAAWLADLHAELNAFPRPRRMLAGAALYSFFFYAVCSISVYVAAHAIGVDAAYASVALLTPALYLVAAIPVSTNNLGWWEWCFSVLLGAVGASFEQGLAVGLALRVVTMIVSLVGGIWLFRRPVRETALSPRTEPHGD
jgi:uncharacterized membrane protein YbhN (UPF0104 family)